MNKAMLMSLMMGIAAISTGRSLYGTPKRGHLSNPNYRVNAKEKKEREFTIKGKKVMAYSRKDALVRLKHKK